MAELGFPIRRRHTGWSRRAHPCRRPAAGHCPPDHLASALVLATAGYRVQPEHTVKTHVRHLLGEPRPHNRIHAAIHAFETGLRTLA